MQRIMIIGQPGSGKSTLARMLGECLGLPVFHIDHIHWQTGWVERARPDKTLLCHEIEAGDQWVFEGGHSTTWGNRLARADLLIWLDLPLPLRFYRVVKRSLRYLGQTRPDLPDGCPERLNAATLTFWRWIWDTRHSARLQMQRLAVSEAASGRLVHLKSPAEVRRWLESLHAK